MLNWLFVRVGIVFTNGEHYHDLITALSGRLIKLVSPLFLTILVFYFRNCSDSVVVFVFHFIL